MVPDIITSKLLPSSSTFSTGPLAVTIQPIYTHYPTWDISLPVIWQRVEPQWNYQRAKLQFLMLVGKGKFKYSEDLEGRRHMGTGAGDKLHLPHRYAGTARNITHPRSAKGEQPHPQLSRSHGRSIRQHFPANWKDRASVFPHPLPQKATAICLN